MRAPRRSSLRRVDTHLGRLPPSTPVHSQCLRTSSSNHATWVWSPTSPSASDSATMIIAVCGFRSAPVASAAEQPAHGAVEGRLSLRRLHWLRGWRPCRAEPAAGGAHRPSTLSPPQGRQRQHQRPVAPPRPHRLGLRGVAPSARRTGASRRHRSRDRVGDDEARSRFHDPSGSPAAGHRLPILDGALAMRTRSAHSRPRRDSEMDDARCRAPRA